MKQKLFTVLLALVASMGIIYASNTQVDGIWYNFNSTNNTAEVTYKGVNFNTYSEYAGVVTIPASVTYSGTTYSVTSIGDYAFGYCSSLTSITIPNSVTSIGWYTFEGCSSLTSVTIGNSVTSIGNGAFWHCSSLASITIPNSVTSIGMDAFRDCSSLASITIPNSVTSIGNGAFNGCSSLTSVTIPNSVTSIGDGAFEDTRLYEDQSNWENGVLYISNYLIKAEENISGTYKIKEGTRLITNGAFFGCSSLTSITIPNSVTSIGKQALDGCKSLTSITIPNSVKSIENFAFSGCSSLRRMIFKGVNPPNRSGLDSNGPHPICYVPCGALEAYALKFHAVMAQFVEQSPYSITINTSNDAYGIAKVASRPDCNSVILTAIPNEGYTFVKWSDGNTQATRYLEVTKDINLTAYFAKEGYTIHVYQDCNITIE